MVCYDTECTPRCTRCKLRWWKENNAKAEKAARLLQILPGPIVTPTALGREGISAVASSSLQVLIRSRRPTNHELESAGTARGTLMIPLSCASRKVVER